MSKTDQVLSAIKLIIDKNGTPSVASIKGALAGTVPLPQIIKGLKLWQANPQIIDDIEKPVSSKKASITQEIDNATDTQKRLESIEAELSEIKSLLQEIKQQLKK